MAARKVKKLLLWLALLLALAVFGGVVFVRSGMLGTVVLRRASTRLGIVLKADDVAVRFDGTWTFRNISASMADQSEAFFVARELRVDATPLLRMLTGSSPEVHSITLEAPVLTLREDTQGKLRLPAIPVKGYTPEADEVPYRIPRVSVNNATLKYADSSESLVTVSPIHLNAVQAADGTVQFELRSPGQAVVSGWFSVSDLRHHVDILIEDGGSFVRDFVKLPFADFSMRASWDGRFDAGGSRRLMGELSLKSITICGITAMAEANVTVDDVRVTATLPHLIVDPWRVLPEGIRPQSCVEGRAGAITWYRAGGLLSIEGINLSALEGSIRGSVSFDFRRFASTSLELEYRNIDVGPFVAELSMEQSYLTGSVVVHPADEARPLEPLLVTLKAQIDGPLATASGLGTIAVIGYLGPHRFVTAHASVPAFRGRFSPWLSATRRDGGIYCRVITDFSDIDLNQLARFFIPDHDDVPGKLSGTARWSMVGKMRDISGSADIRITDSDMINVSVIAAVYKGLNLLLPGIDTRGTGRAILAVQGEALQIRRFEYFNRGAELRGAGSVKDLAAGRGAALAGIITGCLRPLRDTKLPGTEALDELMQSLQVGFVSVEVSGTLGQTRTKLVPLSEVQTSVRKLLWQQLR